MNELNCIRAFVKVVEAGSFAEAARQSGTVKSVITSRINQLEEHLELQLLQRSTRRLTVTDGGADFYERAVHILAELDKAKAEVSSTEWGLTGNFRVSCISAFTHSYLAEDLCEFQQAHPQLKVELHQHNRFCDPVQEGFDVCLQPSGKESGVLESTNILPLKRLIVATPGYLAKYGTPKNYEDLAQHNFAHNNFIDPDCAIQFVDQGSKVKVPIKPDILTNTISMIRAAVTKGEHMAMMPAFDIEEQLLSGELVAILPDKSIAYEQLGAYYRRSSYVPMKVRIFINFLKQKYGEFPPWERRILEKCPDLEQSLRPGQSESL